MTQHSGVTHVSCAVEGLVDSIVIRRVLESLNLQADRIFEAGGKNSLLNRLAGYSAAAQHSPWVVLVDLDSSFDCAPSARKAWMPSVPLNLCFRVVVREIEAWLLADIDALVTFLRVQVSLAPKDPESLDNPKRKLIDLARHSRSSAIREDMVPREGVGAEVGPGYLTQIIEYVRDYWDPA